MQRQHSGNKIHIASTIWITDVVAILRTAFYKQNCLRRALRDRMSEEYDSKQSQALGEFIETNWGIEM